MTEPMSEARLVEIEARDKARTQGTWHACGEGECRCKQVWAEDHPIAQVEHGEWGDSYPSLRLVGNEIDLKAEPYIGLIPYGHIPEDVATANFVFIAACSEDIPDLLREVRRLQQRERELLILMAVGKGAVSEEEAMEALGDTDTTKPYPRVWAARQQGVGIVKAAQAKS